MRRGLSLIELIFTIVIIAIVFTVVPKVILSLNKSDKFAIRQDALFNGFSLMQMISKLPWDENNTDSIDILHTNSGNFICNDISKRRVGGFIGSRSCEENLSAGLISDEGESDYNLFNDIDDFNDIDINASYYTLHVEVNYIDDNITYDGQKAQFVLDDTPISGNTTNLKMVHVDISYHGKRGGVKHISKFNYVSANIGQASLNRRVWR